jgi:hypothetical protein
LVATNLMAMFYPIVKLNGEAVNILNGIVHWVVALINEFYPLQ